MPFLRTDPELRQAARQRTYGGFGLERPMLAIISDVLLARLGAVQRR